MKVVAMSYFLSYSRHDESAVRVLLSDLQRTREDVWLDRELGGGQDWWNEILRQIRGAAVFILAVSTNSLRSRPCLSEMEYASSLGIPILPVQVGEVESFRTTPIAEKQVIDYRERVVANPSTLTLAEPAIDLIVATADLASKRHALPSPLPEEPAIPFEYLMQIRIAVDAEEIPARIQLQVLTQLRQALIDEQDDLARRDVVDLLKRLRRHPNTTYRNALDIDRLFAETRAAELLDAHGVSTMQPAETVEAIQSGADHEDTSVKDNSDDRREIRDETPVVQSGASNTLTPQDVRGSERQEVESKVKSEVKLTTPLLATVTKQSVLEIFTKRGPGAQEKRRVEIPGAVSPHRRKLSDEELAAQQPTNIDEAIECMRQTLLQFHDDRDRRAIFLRLYYIMTLEVHAAINGLGEYTAPIFQDPEWVERLLGKSSSLYFSSLDPAGNPDPKAARAWRTTYETAKEARSSVVQNALLGINAHINFDLPRAIAANLDPDGLDSYRIMQMRKFDHGQVNNLLVRTLNYIQDVLEKDYGHGIAVLDRVLGDFDERLSEIGLKYYRERVWWDAMAHASASPDKQHLVQEKLNWESYKIALFVNSKRWIWRLERALGFLTPRPLRRWRDIELEGPGGVQIDEGIPINYLG
jgi:hypothetical protein